MAQKRISLHSPHHQEIFFFYFSTLPSSYLQEEKEKQIIPLKEIITNTENTVARKEKLRTYKTVKLQLAERLSQLFPESRNLLLYHATTPILQNHFDTNLLSKSIIKRIPATHGIVNLQMIALVNLYIYQKRQENKLSAFAIRSTIFENPTGKFIFGVTQIIAPQNNQQQKEVIQILQKLIWQEISLPTLIYQQTYKVMEVREINILSEKISPVQLRLIVMMGKNHL